jgi:hypothetical protein
VTGDHTRPTEPIRLSGTRALHVVRHDHEPPEPSWEDLIGTHHHQPDALRSDMLGALAWFGVWLLTVTSAVVMVIIVSRTGR